METIVKQTREVGTSAGVLLPRSWLNKQVVVSLFSPNFGEIAKDIIEILFKHKLNEEAKGIYLYGSYARGDYDANSDIDILIITNNTNKLINERNYEIILISEASLLKNLESSLHYLSFLKEAKTLVNQELMENLIKRKKVLDFTKNIVEIEKILRINEDTVKLCRKNGRSIPDGVVYSIILRLRELYLIKCLNAEKQFTKKDFLKITGEKTYKSYSRVKKNERDLDNMQPEEIEPLLELSEKWLKELKE